MEHTMSNDLIAFFSLHPKAGIALAILFTAWGTYTPFILEMQIPVIIMQCIQITAWILGGVASALTILGWYKKHKK